MATFEECISFALSNSGFPLKEGFTLKVKQLETLKALFFKHDSIAILPTGYGKSLIFQLLPWVFQHKYGHPHPMIVLVVSPLSSLMQDQVMGLRKQGIKACCLNISGNHSNCLRTLLLKNLSEVDIAAVMALHYFKPLLPNSTYVIDKSYSSSGKQAKPTKCKLCQQELKYGDTTIGNKKVWHGKVDILLKKPGVSVKVNLEEEFLNPDADELSNDEVVSLEDNHVPFRVIEVKLMKNMRKKIKSQFLAEAIVHAFYTSKSEAKRNQFIPSFLVTEKYIRIVFYNVELDVFLKSTKMSIWKDDDTLNFMTLIRVWLVLNYSSTMHANDRYDYFLKQTVKCHFKESLSPESYQIYLNEMHQPCDMYENHNIVPKVDDIDAVNIEASELDRKELISFFQHARKRMKLP